MDRSNCKENLSQKLSASQNIYLCTELWNIAAHCTKNHKKWFWIHSSLSSANSMGTSVPQCFFNNHRFEGRDAKNGKHGKHACAIFSPKPCYFLNYWCPAPVQLPIFEISACTTCATVLSVGCAFAQLVQTAHFLQVQLTQMAQEPWAEHWQHISLYPYYSLHT